MNFSLSFFLIGPFHLKGVKHKKQHALPQLEPDDTCSDDLPDRVDMRTAALAAKDTDATGKGRSLRQRTSRQRQSLFVCPVGVRAAALIAALKYICFSSNYCKDISVYYNPSFLL